MADPRNALLYDFGEDSPMQYGDDIIGNIDPAYRPKLSYPTGKYDKFDAGLYNTPPGGRAGMIAALPAAFAGGIAKGVPGIVAGGIGAPAAGFLYDAATGWKPRPSPYQGREPMPDQPGSWVPELKYPTEQPMKHPGTLSPIYGPIDKYVEGMGKALGSAEKSATEGGANSGTASRGSMLANMLLTGAPGLAASALKGISAPIDMARGHEVDFGWGDAGNVALAGAAGAVGRMKPRREPDYIPPGGYYNNSNNAPSDKRELFEELSRASKPMESPVLTYRGSKSGDMRFTNPGDGDRGLWSSNKPEIANTYSVGYGGVYGSQRPTIVPANVQFKNPLMVDARGESYSAIPIAGRTTSTDEVAEWARKLGHDGVVFKNVKDAINGGDIPSDVYHAIKRGTVRSPYTNELLYGLSGALGAGASANAIPWGVE